MSDTYNTLALYVSKKKTQRLIKKIYKVLDDHKFEAGIAALVQVLIQVHLDMHTGETEEGEAEICQQCEIASFTTLMQAVRQVNDELLRLAEEAGVEINRDKHDD